MSVHADGQPMHLLGAGDACVIPAGMRCALAGFGNNTELLEVTLPPDCR